MTLKIPKKLIIYSSDRYTQAHNDTFNQVHGVAVSKLMISEKLSGTENFVSRKEKIRFFPKKLKATCTSLKYITRMDYDPHGSNIGLKFYKQLTTRLLNVKKITSNYAESRCSDGNCPIETYRVLKHLIKTYKSLSRFEFFDNYGMKWASRSYLVLKALRFFTKIPDLKLFLNFYKEGYMERFVEKLKWARRRLKFSAEHIQILIWDYEPDFIALPFSNYSKIIENMPHALKLRLNMGIGEDILENAADAFETANQTILVASI